MRLASLLKEYAAEIGIDHLGISRAASIWRPSPPSRKSEGRSSPPFLPPGGDKKPNSTAPRCPVRSCHLSIPYLQVGPRSSG